MSNILSVDKTLELLDSLKSAVSDFVRREEKLNQEFQTGITVRNQRREKAIEGLARKLSLNITESEAAFQEIKKTAAIKYKKRQSRILEAHKVSRKNFLEAIDKKEGNRKHHLQTETMQAHRNHDTGLATTEKRYEQFKADLIQDNNSLELLEKKARKSFRGYKKFLGFLSERGPSLEIAADEYQCASELRGLFTKTTQELDRFKSFFLCRIFKYRWILLVLVLLQIPAVPLLPKFGINSFSYLEAGISVAVFVIAGIILHQIGKKNAEPNAKLIAASVVKARQMLDLCTEKAEVHFKQEMARIEKEFQDKLKWTGDEWNEAVERATESKNSCPRKIDKKERRISAKNEKQYYLKLEELEKTNAAQIEKLKEQSRLAKEELSASSSKEELKFKEENQAKWQVLETEWKNSIKPIYEAIETANVTSAKLFPAWTPQYLKNWVPPAKSEQAAKFARLTVDVEKFSGGIPNDKRLALTGAAQLSVPLSLTHPHQGSVLFETTESGREEAIAALNNIVLRLLSTSAPGKVSFTVVDPVGLGQNFAGVMHLSDYADHLINGRIWTQPAQIEQKLADLNEHMEKVIQMYLRNEYATIAEYNQQAGNIAEKYHFLVIADFPTNFSEVALKRLLSIAAIGAKCGVYTLIHWDQKHPLPPGFVPDELRKASVCLSSKENKFVLSEKTLPGTNLLLDSPPASEAATEFIHTVGKSSRDSARVEVPFSHVAPDDSELWTLETTSELRVPIGRTGATKLQYLAIGKGTRQHALIAGKTGSGKSTLFHTVITNLALWCSPEQVEFYLIDFKKGVEFKCYATHRLPHARVIAIESDREFGLSVLQRIDGELKHRGDLFRKMGVQDIAGYKKAGGTEAVPRSLLIIDEFQEFFTEDDKVSQSASVLLDRIVRQGRAFGIHVFLGSQTLGGAYTMARTTIGQMVIRIALQCNEADAYLIMDDSNSAPRLLSRPGEGIYNDAAGNVQGNSPFQAVWLPDEVRDSYLEKVREKAEQSSVSYSAPIVFEGDAPADVRENLAFKELLQIEPAQPPSSARVWLGAPNSIKGPTEVSFAKQSGNNLLIVGQNDEAILAILSLSLISLAAQYPLGTARFIVFDGNPPSSTQREFLERITQAIPHKITMAKSSELAEIINGVAAEMKSKVADEQSAGGPVTFLFFHGLHKFNKLRYEEDFGFSSDDAEKAANPSVQLNNIISEGPAVGFHVIASCDTYNNINRFLSKKALSEFEMRVLFQMSANDSASLIDTPKAGTLGMHRAVLYSERESYLETFRPYALPTAEWIDQAAGQLSKALTK